LFRHVEDLDDPRFDSLSFLFGKEFQSENRN